MRWLSRAVALAVILTPPAATVSLAQSRSAARAGIPGATPVVRRAADPVRPAAQQPAAPEMTGPDWSAFAGIASGDSPYDIGFALGGSGRWKRSDWPVTARGDLYFAHHSGDIGSQFGGIDLSVNIFGVMGLAEYEFPTESTLKPYAFGGLGLFYSNVSVDYNGEFEAGAYDSSTDLGFGVGGGLRFTPRFGAEIRFMDVGGFTTIPILAVLHF